MTVDCLQTPTLLPDVVDAVCVPWPFWSVFWEVLVGILGEDWGDLLEIR